MGQLLPLQKEAPPPAPGGHLSVLKRVYEEYGAQLRAACVRLGGPGIDPDDLLHEVFVVALKRPEVFNQGDPRAWLYGVAVNVASAARRRQRVRRFLGLEEAEPVEDDFEIDRNLKASEAKREVYAALDRISEKKRTVFVLFELEGLSGEEIARIVNAPLKTVWTRLYHARREFQAALSRQERR